MLDEDLKLPKEISSKATSSRLREIVLYVIGILLALGLAWPVLRLDRDFGSPFHGFYGDGVYYAMLIKTLVETGWVHHNPSLAAPFGLELYDFAHFDNLYLSVMKVLSFFTCNWAYVFNVYYILTYLLTTFSTLILLRWLRFHWPVALTFSLLFAFQRYHLLRSQSHIMLSSYFLIPLQILISLWLTQARALGAHTNACQAMQLTRSRRLWIALAISLAASSGGHYYACFGCLFFLIGGCISSLSHWSLRNVSHALLLCVVTAGGLAINLAPNFAYWMENGHNRQVSEKTPQLSEISGLKIAQLLLPGYEHRVDCFAKLGQRYVATSPLVNENCTSSLGLIAGLGFLVLIAVVFTPRRRERFPVLLVILAFFNLAALLFATHGSFGTLLSYLVTPQLYALNRISIFIAFFCLVAFATLLQLAFARVSKPALRHAGLLISCGLLLGLGLYDQVTKLAAPSHSYYRNIFERDVPFAEAIQRAAPVNGMIFQLPLFNFPYPDGPVGYDSFKGYLYTQGLRWSSGAMKNRRSFHWQEALWCQPVDGMLNALAFAGFDGILIDLKDGRPIDHEIFRQVSELTAIPPIQDGISRHYFDLQPYVARLKSRYSAEQWQECARGALAIEVAWGQTFRGLETSSTEATWYGWRMCAAQTGELTITNHSDKPVTISWNMTLLPATGNPCTISVCGTLMAGEWQVLPAGTCIREVITVPPGRHSHVFTCSGGTPLPSRCDHLWFRVKNPSIHPLLPSPDVSEPAPLNVSAPRLGSVARGDWESEPAGPSVSTQLPPPQH